MLPLAAAALDQQRHAHERAVEEFWLAFHAAAPGPVWDYVMAIDVELNRVEHSQQESWLKEQRPAIEDAIDAVEHAISHQAPDRLAYVQGWVIQWSEVRLGWWFAHERPGAGVTTSVVYDDFVREMAAQALLGWTSAESHAVWLEPERFIERWRVAGTSDSKILAHAGLHAAELDLLSRAA